VDCWLLPAACALIELLTKPIRWTYETLGNSPFLTLPTPLIPAIQKDPPPGRRVPRLPLDGPTPQVPKTEASVLFCQRNLRLLESLTRDPPCVSLLFGRATQLKDGGLFPPPWHRRDHREEGHTERPNPFAYCFYSCECAVPSCSLIEEITRSERLSGMNLFFHLYQTPDPPARQTIPTTGPLVTCRLRRMVRGHGDAAAPVTEL